MGCGSSSVYTREEIDAYLTKQEQRYPSAELIDERQIQLSSDDGFFNGNALLDVSWLQGRLTNAEYRQCIAHINRRVAETKVGQATSVPVAEISTFQSTKLALGELNEKFNGKVRFTFHQGENNERKKSILRIDFP